MLKTAPVLPGVCVGGPEAKAEIPEYNKDAVEGNLTNAFYRDIRPGYVCVSEGRNSNTLRTTVGKWDTCEPIWEDLK